MNKKLLVLLSASIILAATHTRAQTILFSDNFETDTAGDWRVLEGSGDGVSDFTAEFNFDYAKQEVTVGGLTMTIPPAPHSGEGETHGVKLTVNANDEVAATSGVSLFPNGGNFSGDYALRFDMWLDYNGAAWGGSGSTEFATCGLNHSGDLPVWDDPKALDSDGVWFAVTGEGGASRDYRAYAGFPLDRTEELLGLDAGFLDRDGDGLIEAEVNSTQTETFPLQAIFPADKSETPGAPGKQWVQVEVRQRADEIVWLMNGYIIAGRPNFSEFDAGNVMIGAMDVFTSIAEPREDNFVLFDNVRVVDLEGEDELPIVSVDPGSAAAEPSTNGGFLVSRAGGDGAQALAVQYRTIGTASMGEDYEPLAPAIDLPAGKSEVEVVIQLIDDSVGEPTEQVTFILEGGADYEIRDFMIATIDLEDDGDTTLVEVTAVDAYAYERLADDAMVFEITRLGEVGTDLDVEFTLGGTADADADYATDGRVALLLFGESSVRVEFWPIDDNETEEAETVRIELVPGDGYELGPSATAEATLIDDDIPEGEVLFEADFNTDGVADWLVRFDASNGIDDYYADFSFDYGALLIPPAPHGGGDTRGLQLAVNKDDPTDGGKAGISVYPRGREFSGNFALRCDLYLSYGADTSGTTEHATLGLDHSGDYANRYDTAGSDGIWFAIESDGSASGGRSYVSFLGGPTGEEKPSFTAKPAGDLAPFFTAPPYLASGAPSGQWVDVELAQVNGTIRLSLNGVEVFNGVKSENYTAGNLMLGHMDTYNSVGSLDNFVIYDNVRVVRMEGAAVAPTITSVQIEGLRVVLRLSAPGASRDELIVEQVTEIGADFAEAPGAVVEETGAGEFQASIPLGASGEAFFRVRR